MKFVRAAFKVKNHIVQQEHTASCQLTAISYQVQVLLADSG